MHWTSILSPVTANITLLSVPLKNWVDNTASLKLHKTDLADCLSLCQTQVHFYATALYARCVPLSCRACLFLGDPLAFILEAVAGATQRWHLPVRKPFIIFDNNSPWQEQISGKRLQRKQVGCHMRRGLALLSNNETAFCQTSYFLVLIYSRLESDTDEIPQGRISQNWYPQFSLIFFSSFSSHTPLSEKPSFRSGKFFYCSIKMKRCTNGNVFHFVAIILSVQTQLTKEVLKGPQ